MVILGAIVVWIILLVFVMFVNYEFDYILRYSSEDSTLGGMNSKARSHTRSHASSHARSHASSYEPIMPNLPTFKWALKVPTSTPEERAAGIDPDYPFMTINPDYLASDQSNATNIISTQLYIKRKPYSVPALCITMGMVLNTSVRHKMLLVESRAAIYSTYDGKGDYVMWHGDTGIHFKLNSDTTISSAILLANYLDNKWTVLKSSAADADQMRDIIDKCIRRHEATGAYVPDGYMHDITMYDPMKMTDKLRYRGNHVGTLPRNTTMYDWVIFDLSSVGEGRPGHIRKSKKDEEVPELMDFVGYLNRFGGLVGNSDGAECVMYELDDTSQRFIMSVSGITRGDVTKSALSIFVDPYTEIGVWVEGNKFLYMQHIADKIGGWTDTSQNGKWTLSNQSVKSIYKVYHDGMPPNVSSKVAFVPTKSYGIPTSVFFMHKLYMKTTLANFPEVGISFAKLVSDCTKASSGLGVIVLKEPTSEPAEECFSDEPGATYVVQKGVKPFLPRRHPISDLAGHKFDMRVTVVCMGDESSMQIYIGRNSILRHSAQKYDEASMSGEITNFSAGIRNMQASEIREACFYMISHDLMYPESSNILTLVDSAEILYVVNDILIPYVTEKLQKTDLSDDKTVLRCYHTGCKFGSNYGSSTLTKCIFPLGFDIYKYRNGGIRVFEVNTKPGTGTGDMNYGIISFTAAVLLVLSELIVLMTKIGNGITKLDARECDAVEIEEHIPDSYFPVYDMVTKGNQDALDDFVFDPHNEEICLIGDAEMIMDRGRGIVYSINDFISSARNARGPSGPSGPRLPPIGILVLQEQTESGLYVAIHLACRKSASWKLDVLRAVMSAVCNEYPGEWTKTKVEVIHDGRGPVPKFGSMRKQGVGISRPMIDVHLDLTNCKELADEFEHMITVDSDYIARADVRDKRMYVIKRSSTYLPVH